MVHANLVRYRASIIVVMHIVFSIFIVLFAFIEIL